MNERSMNHESADVPQVTEEASILGVILEVGAMEEAIEARQFSGNDLPNNTEDEVDE